MNTTELKKLAEACENAAHMMTQGHKRHQAESALKDLVTHESIAKLLAINAELVEMVKDAAVLADFAECWVTDPAIEGMSRLKGGGDKFRAALAKAEGGEL